MERSIYPSYRAGVNQGAIDRKFQKPLPFPEKEIMNDPKNLLFIGGVDDGCWRVIPRGQEVVSVPWMPRRPAVTFSEQPVPPSNGVEFQTDHYTRRYIIVGDRPFELMAKHNLTDSDAFERLMIAYGTI